MRPLIIAAALFSSACSLLLDSSPDKSDASMPDATPPQGFSLAWAQTIAGNGDDEPRGLLVDAGIVYVVGHVTEGVEFGDFEPNGVVGDQGFVAAYDDAGNRADQKILTISEDSKVLAVAANASHVFVGGRWSGEIGFGSGTTNTTPTGSSDGFVVRYSKATDAVSFQDRGELIFTGDGVQRITSLSVDQDRLLLGGVFAGPTTDLDGSNTDITPTGGDLSDSAYAAKVTSDQFSYRWSLASASDTLLDDAVFSVIEDPGFRDSYAAGISGGAFDPVGSGRDGYIAKVDSGGADDWSRGIPGAASVSSDDLTLVTGDLVCTAGRFESTLVWDQNREFTREGGSDSYIGCLDRVTGEPAWVRIVSGPGEADNDKLLGTDDLIAVGNFDGDLRIGDGDDALTASSAGLHDIYILELDNSGEPTRLTTLSSTGDMNVGGVGRLPDGNIVITGAYRDRVLLNGEPITPEAKGSSADIFVIALRDQAVNGD